MNQATARRRSPLKFMLRLLGLFLLIYFGLIAVVYLRQRAMLFFPSHHSHSGELTPWSDGQRTIGVCSEIPNPRAIWLMMHGNAGQASDRSYVRQRMSPQDSLYVLEYPGYGLREGYPSRETMNQAAADAYRLLRARHPNTPVCVLGESIGSGPACSLATEKVPPNKIILVVPFDTLANTAAGHFGFLPVRLLLRDRWDNIEALKEYQGPVDIYGATNDTIIPAARARALAKELPKGKLVLIDGGHNDWADQPQVRIEL